MRTRLDHRRGAPAVAWTKRLPACKARSGGVAIWPDDERRRSRCPWGMSVGVRLRPLKSVVNGTVVARPARTTVAGPRSVGIRSTLGLPRTCAVTSRGMRTVCEQMVSRVALPGERAADPFGRLWDGWRGRGSVGPVGCTHSWSNPTGWLTGSGRLGARRSKTRRTPCPVPSQVSPKSARMLHGR